MEKTIDAVFSAPLANILVVAGIVFLLVAVLGTVVGKIDPGKGGRIAAGAIGLVLLVVGLSMHLFVAKISDSDKREKEESRTQQLDVEEARLKAAEEARRKATEAKPPNSCDPIRVPEGATCSDFYAERSNWDIEKIHKCGLYQVGRYWEALNIRSKSEWGRFLSPCK